MIACKYTCSKHIEDHMHVWHLDYNNYIFTEIIEYSTCSTRYCTYFVWLTTSTIFIADLWNFAGCLRSYCIFICTWHLEFGMKTNILHFLTFLLHNGCSMLKRIDFELLGNAWDIFEESNLKYFLKVNDWIHISVFILLIGFTKYGISTKFICYL